MVSAPPAPSLLQRRALPLCHSSATHATHRPNPTHATHTADQGTHKLLSKFVGQTSQIASLPYYEQLYRIILQLAGPTGWTTVRAIQQNWQLSDNQARYRLRIMRQAGWVVCAAQPRVNFAKRVLHVLPVRRGNAKAIATRDETTGNIRKRLLLTVLETWMFYPTSADLAAWCDLTFSVTRQHLKALLRSGKLIAFKPAGRCLPYIYFPPGATHEIEKAKNSVPSRGTNMRMLVLERHINSWVKNSTRAACTNKSQAKIVRAVFSKLNVGVWEVSGDILLDHLARLRQQGMRDATLWTYVSSLRSFFRHYQGAHSPIASNLSLKNVKLQHELRARQGEVTTIRLKREKKFDLRVGIRDEGALLKECALNAMKGLLT